MSNTPSSTSLIRIQIISPSRTKTLSLPLDTLIQHVIIHLLNTHQCDALTHRYFAMFLHGKDICMALHPQLCLRDVHLSHEHTITLKPRNWKSPCHLGKSSSMASQLFSQHVNYAIINEVFPVSERHATRLAALRLQWQFGDHDPERHHIGFLNKVGLAEYLPGSVSPHNYAYWHRRIFKSYERLRGIAPHDAMMMYVREAMASPYYGMAFFEVLDENSAPFLLAIAEDGIFAFSPEHLAPQMHISYTQMRTWRQTLEGIELIYRIDDSLTDHATEFTMPQHKRLTAYNLICEYYYLYPETYRSSFTRPPHFDTNVPLMPKPEDYGPVIKRAPLYAFQSRVELFKILYIRLCAAGKVPVVRQLCMQLDDTMDEDRELTTLDLSKCRISKESFIIISRAFAAACTYQVPSNHTLWRNDICLKTLSLAHNDLPHAVVKCLNAFLSHYPLLTTLDVSNVCFRNDGAKLLATTIATHMQHLEKLTVRNADIGNKGFVALLEAIKGNTSFCALDMCKNRIGDSKLVSFLPALLKSHPNFTELRLAGNRISTRGFDSLARHICTSTTFRTLDMSYNPLTNRACKALANALQSNTSLRSLTWRQNRMKGEGLLQLVRAVRDAKRLEYLDLSSTYTTVHLKKPIAVSYCKFLLKPHTRLRELRLANNSYGLNFAETLAEAMQKNQVLELLDISNTDCSTSKGDLPAQWIEALTTNSTLRVLRMCNVDIGGLGFRTIFRALEKNSTVKELYASQNELPLSSLNDLRLFLEITSLEKLELRQCALSDKHVPGILKGLVAAKSLHVLDLRGNEFTSEALGLAGFVGMQRSTHRKLLHVDVASEIPEEHRYTILTEFFIEIVR